jgi:hypothetical protein
MKTMSQRLLCAVVLVMLATPNVFRHACAAPTATVSCAGVQNESSPDFISSPLSFLRLEHPHAEAASIEHLFADETALSALTPPLPPPLPLHAISFILLHTADRNEVSLTSP